MYVTACTIAVSNDCPWPVSVVTDTQTGTHTHTHRMITITFAHAPMVNNILECNILSITTESLTSLPDRFHAPGSQPLKLGRRIPLQRE